MTRFLPIALLTTMCLACSGGPDASEPKQPERVADPAKLIANGKVFRGPEGIRVTLVTLKGGDKALIKVIGTRGDVEGMVLEYTLKDEGRWLRYLTQINGRDRATLVREQRRGSDAPIWYLNVRGGGHRDSIKVPYHDEDSANADTVAIYREYEDQVADGSLAALAAFDRKGDADQEAEDLNEELKRLNRDCKSEVSVAIDWDTIDDELLKTRSISGYCSPPLDAMRRLCSAEPARRFVQQNVRSVTCRFGDKVAFALTDGALTWTTHTDGSRMDQFARKQLRKQTMNGKTLDEHLRLAATKVCVDRKRKRYILLPASGSEYEGILYGDGATYFHTKGARGLSDGWFFDPRFFNKSYNPNFRGMDVRNFSHVDVKEKAGECALTCGTHETRFSLLSGDEAAKIASSIKQVKPPPLQRAPYALARDRKGTYYYVDRSTVRGQEKYFLLYVGPLGNLKKQRMKDIVSDSEGEIFSSKAGDLRLVLDKEKALWITTKRNRQLTRVPVERNYQLIYNRLGVYLGAKLGTPCDDYGN